MNALKIKLCISEVFLITPFGPDSSVTISVCELCCTRSFGVKAQVKCLFITAEWRELPLICRVCTHSFLHTVMEIYTVLVKEKPLLSCDTFNNLFLTTVLWAKGLPGIFWDGSTWTGGRPVKVAVCSKTLMSWPLPSRDNELLAMSRLKLKVAVGILTGHTTLTTHLF